MKELTKEIIQYIGAVKKEYEKRYHIQILMWTVRKSFLRGLERKTSDLDVVFVFQNLDSKKKKIIFERANRRIELQCWDIQDILEIIAENKRRSLQEKEFCPYYKSNELKHYILDYYHGFYAGWDSALMKDEYGFCQNCGKHIFHLYEPFVVANMLYLDLKGQCKRVEMGYWLSLNEYINAIWSGLAGLHALSNGRPSDTQIRFLAETYLNGEEAKMLLSYVAHFKQTVQKQSNYCNMEALNQMLLDLKLRLEKKMKQFNIQEIDIEKELLDIQGQLKEMRSVYENSSC